MYIHLLEQLACVIIHFETSKPWRTDRLCGRVIVAYPGTQILLNGGGHVNHILLPDILVLVFVLIQLSLCLAPSQLV